MRRCFASVLPVVTLTALLGCDLTPTAPDGFPPRQNTEIPVPIVPVEVPANLPGRYTLTIEVDDSCPFPQPLKTRNYEVVFDETPYAYFGVRPVSRDTYMGGDLWEPGANGAFRFNWNTFDLPACDAADMTGPSALSLCGGGLANVGEGTIRGVLTGSAYLGEGAERPACVNAQHRFVFQRRS